MNSEQDVIAALQSIDFRVRTRILNQFLDLYKTPIRLLCCNNCNALGFVRDGNFFDFSSCNLCLQVYCGRCKPDRKSELCPKCA